MNLSRRDVLRLLLGSALGNVACRRTQPRPIPGRVVGGQMERGHRIRTPEHVPDTVPSSSVPIVIVGGGIAGLSAAWRLERRGEPRFVIFELESQPGGTSTYGTDGVVAYPWGAHYLPLPAPHHASLCELLFELGAVETDVNGHLRGRERCIVRDPDERLFVAGQWVEGLEPTPLLSHGDRSQIGRFARVVRDWIAWQDGGGRRAFELPLVRCSEDEQVLSLDRISAAQWLQQHRFDSKPLRWMIEYACRDDYGCSLETTSAWAMLFYYAARTARSDASSAPFLTWPEGNGRIVRHLERAAGPRLRCNRVVTDVAPIDDRVRVTVLDPVANRYEIIWAEQVILSTPSFVTRHIVRPFRDAPPDHYDGFTYSPWLVANLHLRKRPRSRGFPLAWDNVIYGGASLGYVVATHQTLEDDGPTIWTYYQPLVDPDLALARGRLAVAEQPAAWDAIVAELGAAHPDLAECATRLDVWHYGHAMIRPVPGFISGAARRRAAQPYRRIYFAHTDLSGMALLDEAHYHGVRAADEVVSARRG